MGLQEIKIDLKEIAGHGHMNNNHLDLTIG